MLNTLYVGFKAFYLLEVNSPIKFGHWIQFSNPLDPFIFVFLSVSSSSSPLSWNPVVSGGLRWLLPHVWDERRTLKGPEIWITCSEGEIRRRRRRRRRPRCRRRRFCPSFRRFALKVKDNEEAKDKFFLMEAFFAPPRKKTLPTLLMSTTTTTTTTTPGATTWMAAMWSR